MDLLSGRMDLINSQVKLWKARKELAAIIFERDQGNLFNGAGGGGRPFLNNGTGFDQWWYRANTCLHILRRHPALAKERFYRVLAFKLYPLSFLLQIGADLSIIQEVYRMNPKVLSQKVYNQVGKREPDGYPLHLVCGSRHVSEEVILFLIEQHREAAQKQSSGGELPIHVLLQNRGHVATAAEVKALLDANDNNHNNRNHYSPCDDVPNLLSLAFQNENTHQDVLEVLIDRFPADCNEFHWGGVAVNLDELEYRYIRVQGREISMTPRRVDALFKLSPRLKVLSCVASQWLGSSFQSFTEGLVLMKRKMTLTDLTLSLPACLLRSKNVLHLDLKKLLEQNTTLQHLHIDFGTYHVDDHRNDQANISASKRIETILSGLLFGLQNNHSLKECHLTGGLVNQPELDFFHNTFWPLLASLLGEGNATLELVSVPKAYYRQTVDESKSATSTGSSKITEVRHWTRLNRFGRCKIRHPNVSIDGVVGIISKVNEAQDLLPTVKSTTLFGLLSESPSIWSSVQGKHKD